MRITPQAGQNIFVHRLLLGLLLVVSIVYLALYYYVEQVLPQPDYGYSMVPNPQLRVGYCMATSATGPEKYAVAESAARPPSKEIYAVVLPYVNVGDVTAQQQAILRALRERDQLRQRAIEIASKVAAKCHYEKIGWPSEVTPLEVAERWLRHDRDFLSFLDKVTQHGPDEAERLYVSLTSRRLSR